MSELYDCHTHIGIELGHYLTGSFPYCQHFTDLCRDLDAAAIEKVVVFPMVTHFGMELDALRDGKVVPTMVPWSRYPYEFENAHFLAEIYDLFADLAHRAVPLVMIDPSRQTRPQLQNIASLAERYPIAGLKMQGTMIQSFVSDLPKSGFLDLAAERDWPVLIHTSVHPDDPWSQVTDILDVAEAWPQLRFNVAHTLRFDAPLLERLAGLPNAWFDVSAFCIHCDLAVQESPVVAAPERRFATDYADCGRALRDFAEAWPDRLLWGSDAPYYSYVAPYVDAEGNVITFDLRSSMARETAALRALSPAMIERVAGDNPRAWLTGK